MTRQTSAAVYHMVLGDGTINKQQTAIYAALYGHGPMTATECIRHINKTTEHNYSENTHTRFTELRERGLLQECTPRPCQETGMTCIAWDVTDQLPGPKPPPRVPKPKPEQLAAAAVQLRQKLAVLKIHGFIADYDDVAELVALGRWLTNYES